MRLGALARCPFDWPATVPSDDAGPSSAGSPQRPKIVKGRLLTSQSTTLAGDYSTESLEDQLPLAQWLRARYFECLWLGEHHFPLADFPLVLNQLLRRARELHTHADASDDYDNGPKAANLAEKGAVAAIEAIASLLPSKSAIQQKFREDFTAEGRLEAMLGINNSASSVESQKTRAACNGGGEEDFSVKAALSSGQGSLVAAEVRRASELRPLQAAEQGSQLSDSTGQHINAGLSTTRTDSSLSRELKLRDQWLTAIERRE